MSRCKRKDTTAGQASPAELQKEIGVLTRARRASFLGDCKTSRSDMSAGTDESSSDDSASDSTSASESETPTNNSQGETGGRGRICQGGFDFLDLELPVADLGQMTRRPLSPKGGPKEIEGGLHDRLARANTALMLSALPNSLPCRDEEKQQIQNVMEEFFSQRTGRSLYICGVPGTGKTATTMEVVHRYEGRQDTKFVLLNCLSMASVSDLYSALHSSLMGKEAGRSSALAQLTKYFTETEELTVLILDEMDVLLTKKSTELYNLFEWCWEGGRLCILGISNTVNLPKRLPAPIQKRMGTNSLTFKPYTKVQMEWIVKDRLGDLDVFHELAIQRAAAKVAHANGDVRRCLQLLQLSIDIFQRPTTERNDKITAHHVGEAISEMFGDEILSDLDTTEKLLLASILFSSRATTNDDTSASASEMLQRVGDSARLSGIPLPTDACLLHAICNLHTAGIITIEDPQKRLFERASLNVLETDVTKVIAQDHRLERLSTSLRM